MLKRRTSKRFVLAESGEEATWDPTAAENAAAAEDGVTMVVPRISEPMPERENDEAPSSSGDEASERRKSLESAINIAFAMAQETNSKLLRVSTGGLKYVLVLYCGTLLKLRVENFRIAYLVDLFNFTL